jgi:hypothetical protein
MDLTALTLPTLLALVISYGLKRHEKFENAAIPYFNLASQFLLALLQDLGTSVPTGHATVDTSAALVKAVTVTATATVAHQGLKTAKQLIVKALPAVGAFLLKQFVHLP